MSITNTQNKELLWNVLSNNNVFNNIPENNFHNVKNIFEDTIKNIDYNISNIDYKGAPNKSWDLGSTIHKGDVNKFGVMGRKLFFTQRHNNPLNESYLRMLKLSNMNMIIKIQYLKNSEKFHTPYWIDEKKLDNYMLPSFTKKIVKYLEKN